MWIALIIFSAQKVSVSWTGAQAKNSQKAHNRKSTGEWHNFPPKNPSNENDEINK